MMMSLSFQHHNLVLYAMYALQTVTQCPQDRMILKGTQKLEDQCHYNFQKGINLRDYLIPWNAEPRISMLPTVVS
jgi:hypothetical protein